MTIDINGYGFNYSRISHMLSGSRSEATHMGLWDRFKDLFRTEKKEQALQALYDVLYSEHVSYQLIEGNNENHPSTHEWYGIISVFERLKDCAGQAQRDRFGISYDTENRVINFFIDNHAVKKIKMDVVLSDIIIDGKYFIKNYQDIINSNISKINDYLTSSNDKEYTDFHYHYFYTQYPLLKEILLSCHMQHSDMMGSIMSDLTRDKLMNSQMALNLKMMQEHLTEKLSGEPQHEGLKGTRYHTL